MIDQELQQFEPKIAEFNEMKVRVNRSIVELELEIVKEKKRLREEQEKQKRIKE